MHVPPLIAALYQQLLFCPCTSKARRPSTVTKTRATQRASSLRMLQSRAVPVQMTKEELVQSLRRQSKGYHQNSSQYRGVTKHQKGKWEARIGQVRHVCLSTVTTPHAGHTSIAPA